jgi:Fe-coproporphyrin III synthase
MSINKTKQPTSAVIAVTYKCNSRCKMCNIWQKPETAEISPDVFLKLPASLKDINITGGEPYLRNDIIEILDNIEQRCHPAKIVISSNGYLTEKITATAKEILNKKYGHKVTIALSLDSIGPMHGEIRGIAGAYEMVLQTINGLKLIGFENIGIGYTFMSGNETEYEKVYQFALKNNLNFGATIAHNAENYFSTSTNSAVDSAQVKKQIDSTIKNKIKSFSKTELGKCYYMHGLEFYSLTKKSLLPCDALASSFFMNPTGEVFPCNILDKSIGNLQTVNFQAIWQGDKAEHVRATVKKCPNPCWMVCTAKPAIKKHWLRAGMWLLKEKVLNLF